MEKILSISQKLNFTPNTMGCYGLMFIRRRTLLQDDGLPSLKFLVCSGFSYKKFLSSDRSHIICDFGRFHERKRSVLITNIVFAYHDFRVNRLTQSP